MPTYQYACTACGDELEAVQSFTDDALTECPACQGALRKVYSAVGVVFKGSGFYKNDSRSTGTNGKTSTDSSGDTGSKGDSGGKVSKTDSGTKTDSGATSGSSTPAPSTAATSPSKASTPAAKTA